MNTTQAHGCHRCGEELGSTGHCAICATFVDVPELLVVAELAREAVRDLPASSQVRYRLLGALDALDRARARRVGTKGVR